VRDRKFATAGSRICKTQVALTRFSAPLIPNTQALSLIGARDQVSARAVGACVLTESFQTVHRDASGE
jgi:hypothetical protein